MAHDVYIRLQGDRIMMTLAVVAFILGAIVLTVGVTLSDLKRIRADQSYQRAPHARRWRKKPIVLVETTDEGSLRALRKSYRKVSSATDEGWRLHIPEGLVITPQEIPQAVRQLQYDPIQQYIPLSVHHGSAHDLRRLLGTYRSALSAQSASLRHGFGIMPVGNQPYLEISSTAINPLRTLAYELASILLATTAIIVFIAGFGLALLTQQTDLLVGFIAASTLLAIWSIGRLQGLSFWRKLVLVILLPAAFAYLYFLLVSMPARTAARLGRPLSAIIST